VIDWIKEKFDALREKAKGWKTVIVGAFFGLPLLLAQILSALSLVDLTTILPEPWGARLALTVSLAMIFMRFTVTGPVGAKGDEKPDADTKAGD
jgi:hypothetical protein